MDKINMNIDIKDYLTEDSLGTILKNNLNHNIFAQFPKKSDKDHMELLKKYGISEDICSNGFRFDFAYDNGSKLVLVEFQGYMHYSDFKTVKRDFRKLSLWKNSSLQVDIIELPFFIQLDPSTSKFFFGKEFNNFTVGNKDLSKFQHGFISKEAQEGMVPASFCKKGYEKYESFMKDLPYNVREDVYSSLVNIEKSGVGREWIY